MDDSGFAPRRGGCLTAFLILMLVANCGIASAYALGGSWMRDNLPALPAWAPAVLALGGLVNLGLAWALWKWRLWAMWGLVGITLLSGGINWLSLGWVSALVGLVGGLINIAILTLLLTSALSYPREWRIEGTVTHTVRVEHEAVFSGRVYLFLDDRVIFRRWSKFWDSGLRHLFEVEGTRCELRIVYRLWYYDYRLWVDGVRQPVSGLVVNPGRR